MAFWNRKKVTHTDAPSHWPKVELDQFDNPAVNTIIIAGALADLMQPPKSTLALMQDFVYDDGILSVPIVVEEGGRKTCVVAYSKQDGKDAASHYATVRTLLKVREKAATVYYGPEPLGPAKPLPNASVLSPIDTSHFTKAEDQAEASYALWWASAEGGALARSPERTSIDRWFQALDGWGWVVFTALVRDLELAEGDGPFALPEQPLLVPVTGPGGTDMLLHASRDGLFFAFAETTPVARRRTLLRLLGDFAQQFRKAIDAKRLPANEEEKGRAVQAWKAMCDAALAKEAAGGTDLVLHRVAVKGGQPERSPHATTAADRAAAPTRAGREELDFAMDVVDRAVEKVRARKHTAGSSQQELGMPNIAPIIAARVNGDVYERHVPLEDAEQAKAAAGRALDEWPEADLVAVILDAAIRENGARVDVFTADVQNAKTGAAANVFQRYKVDARGTLELIGRPTAMGLGAFLNPAGAIATPAPDEGLVALVQKAVDDIVTTLTIIDASGASGGDPDDTLFSPSAFVGRPGDDSRPLTVRFMMQGPITAALSCLQSLQEKPADWVVYHLDDVVTRNGAPDRRFRLCAQRKGDAATAIFDQFYEMPQKGKPFTLRGGLQFRRWAGPFLPVA